MQPFLDWSPCTSITARMGLGIRPQIETQLLELCNERFARVGK